MRYLILILALVGCTQADGKPKSGPTPQVTPSPAPTATPTPAVTPTPEPTATPLPTPVPIYPDYVFVFEDELARCYRYHNEYGHMDTMSCVRKGN